VIFGAEVDHHERPSPGDRLDLVLQKPLAPTVPAVKILEEKDGQLAAALRVSQALQECDEPPLLCLGLHRRRRVPGVRDAEKVVEQWKSVIQLLVEAERPPSDLVTDRFLTVVLLDPEIVAHGLQHGEKGDRFSVRHTVPRNDEDPPRSEPLDELEAEPALADSRVGDDPDDLCASRKRPLERIVQYRHVSLASDELRESPRA
jgi:hypothetical protein